MSEEHPTNPETPVNGSESPPVSVLKDGEVAPFGFKADGSARKRPGLGRRPLGSKSPRSDKKTYDPKELAENVAATISQGKGLRRSPNLSAVSVEDRRQLTRITGESVEIFNERIALNLREIADLATQRIREKLESDEFKAGELGFILSVAHDKRLSLDGSRALNNASVNIQVNNYGSAPKETLLGELDGLGNTKQAIPA